MVKAYVNNGMSQPISDTVQIERVASVPNPTEVLGIRELQIANTSFVDLEPISLSVEGKYITATQIIVSSGSLYLAETDGVTPPTNSMSTEVAEGSIISLYTDPAKVFLKAKTATAGIVIKYLSGNKGAEIGSRGGSVVAVSNFPTDYPDANLPTPGQKAMTASVPVVLASDQSTVPVQVQNQPTNYPNANIPTPGQKAMTASVPVVLASDQSTVPTSVSQDINTAPFGAYPTGTNLITGDTSYVSLASLGDPQALRFSLQILGTFNNFQVNVSLADDAIGTNAVSVQLRYESLTYGAPSVYTSGVSSVVNQTIETVKWPIAKFVSILLTSAGTGGGQIRIRRLSALKTPIYMQVENVPLQQSSFNTTQNSANSYAQVTHVSSIVGHATQNNTQPPTDSDTRLKTDGVSPLPSSMASPYTIYSWINSSSRTVNLSGFTFATGDQSLLIGSPKFIGLLTLELSVTASGSGGALDIDFMYESGVTASVFAKPFPRITASGIYTTTLFIPRNTQLVYLRYRYVGTAGSTFNVSAPNWLKGSHYGPEMYKNIYYDYTTLAANTATSQTIDLEMHPYAKRIMFMATTSTAGSATLSYEHSLDGTNWFKISGSEAVATLSLNQPIAASLNNGLSPITLLKFVRVRLETGSTAVLSPGGRFLISN